MSDDGKLKISWDDLKSPKVDEELQRQRQAAAPSAPWAGPTVASGGKAYPPLRVPEGDVFHPASKQYGLIAPQPAAPTARAGIYSTPLYTCLAGLAGALIGWALTEATCRPDALRGESAVYFLAWFGLNGACVGAAIGSVEGIMSRAPRRAFKGGAIGLGVGLVGWAIGGFVAGLIFAAILYGASSGGISEPSFGWFMVARTIGWGVAGCFLGLGQGIAMLSPKKILNGFLGGLGGGLVGGFLFDPIGLATRSGIVSRLVGLALIGAAAGLLMGLVEQWLKHAWVHVASGPLAGKQFVIYKNPTVIGSSPKCDIYLFKDPAIEPRHAAISNDGHIYSVQDCGSPAGTYVNGRRVASQRLKSGDRVQVGGTTFIYSEKPGRRRAEGRA